MKMGTPSESLNEVSFPEALISPKLFLHVGRVEIMETPIVSQPYD